MEDLGLFQFLELFVNERLSVILLGSGDRGRRAVRLSEGQLALACVYGWENPIKIDLEMDGKKMYLRAASFVFRSLTKLLLRSTWQGLHRLFCPSHLSSHQRKQ